MLPWLSAIARLGGDLAQREIGRLAAVLAFWVLGGLLAFGAIGFVVGGIYISIATPLGPIAASFIMAGGLFVMALIAFFVASRRGRSVRPVRPSVQVAAELELDEAPGPRASVAAVVAAFAFGLARGFTRRRKQ